MAVAMTLRARKADNHRMLAFAGLARPVAFSGCEPVIAHLDALLPSWPIGEAGGEDGTPVIALARTHAGFALASPWTRPPQPFADPLDAACALIVDLVHAHAADNPATLCLHAAAADLGDGATLFPCPHGAGKSTLVVALAARDRTVFADDVLALAPPDDVLRFAPSGDLLRLAPSGDVAVAFGIAPRPRLPLPPGVGFGPLRAGPGTRHYRYLSLKPTLLAPFGATAPARRSVILDRVDDATGARLTRAGADDILKSLIPRNFGPGRDAVAIFARLRHLVEDAERARLVYGDCDAAADTLIAAFGS